MTRKEKKRLKERQSTRQLMDVGPFTPFGLQTGHGELACFLMKPINLSALSQERIHARILALGNLLRGVESLEMLALDSRESFHSNKNFYQSRMESEPLPAIRELLAQDVEHLDQIRLTTSLDRAFGLLLRFREPPTGEKLNRMEQLMHDQGFRVYRARSRTGCASWQSTTSRTSQVC